MSQLLPILDTERRQRASRRSIIAAVLRCALVLAIAVAIRVSHANQNSVSTAAESIVVPIQQVQQWLPNAVAAGKSHDGLMAVKDEAGAVIGSVIATLPAAQHVIGYRGPSNTLLFLDETSTVIAAELLDSQDTPEHVDAVNRDGEFFNQFQGWSLGDQSTQGAVDSVSGATLTSLAIAEGIAVRLGSEKPSLRFPDSFSIADLDKIVGVDTDGDLNSVNSYEAVVTDSEFNVSRLLRTGPLVDSISGYQGPSELLIHLDDRQKVIHLSLRRTFDNQPYAGYLDEDTYFWKAFQQKTLREISKIDLEAEQVEGVSGATMTSLAVADTIVAAAKEYEIRRQQASPEVQRRTVHWGLHDIGTLLVLLCGTAIALTRLRGIRWLRVVWNVALVAYLGLMTGNLISLAVVFGWAGRGIAWQLAPGLASVVVVSFVLSAFTRRNVYCSHICPHGAAQQLLRRKAVRSERLRGILKRIKWMPGAILVAAAVVTFLRLESNLAAWEPFNAYIWYVAGLTSITVAVLSLVFAWFVPMGYCRHACGTGRLLDYVRRSAASDRLTIADGVTVCLAVGSWMCLVA